MHAINGIGAEKLALAVDPLHQDTRVAQVAEHARGGHVGVLDAKGQTAEELRNEAVGLWTGVFG